MMPTSINRKFRYWGQFAENCVGDKIQTKN